MLIIINSAITILIRKENIFKTKVIEICNKYDTYGKSVTSKSIWNKIKKGDLVEYIDTKSVREGKCSKTIKVSLQGIWDGEKVCFTDNDHTIVRTTHWLRKITTIEKFKAIALKIYKTYIL